MRSMLSASLALAFALSVSASAQGDVVVYQRRPARMMMVRPGGAVWVGYPGRPVVAPQRVVYAPRAIVAPTVPARPVVVQQVVPVARPVVVQPVPARPRVSIGVGVAVP